MHALLGVIAGWAVVNGLAELFGAIRVRGLQPGELACAVAAISISALGTGLLVAAGPGGVRPWMISGYTLASGMLLIALGVGVRRWSRLGAHATA